jgi:hypothetical protein
MNLPQLILFDMDGTLASSKQSVDPEMAHLLADLLSKTKGAIISGGGYEQFETQFFPSFDGIPVAFENLYLLPTSGAAMYRYEAGAWQKIYQETFTTDEKQQVREALAKALEESGYVAPETIYGETIEDRDSQISFSANGQEAPLAVKSVWDPNHEKRERIISYLQNYLPDFSIEIGGTNTIDITKPGVDKTYGIMRIGKELAIAQEDMFYIGDSIFPGGNDYVVTTTNVPWRKVSGPEETKQVIRELLSL